MGNRRRWDDRSCSQVTKRNWSTSNMIPNLSRPSSRLSKAGSLQNSLQEVDWVSLAGPRSSSRLSSHGDSGYSLRRRQSKGSLEEILSKHPGARPRSVSLVKYEPLPAIISDSVKIDSEVIPVKKEVNTLEESEEQSSENRLVKVVESPTISPIEEQESEHLNQDSDQDKADTEQENTIDESNTEESNENAMPKLVRSRTFDVIETNLTNLPIINSSSSSIERETMDDEPETGLDNSDDESKSKIEMRVNIDGISLPTFLTQSGEGSSLSLLSLVTHPGSPDSGYDMDSGTLSGRSQHGFDIVNNNEGDISDVEVTDPNLNLKEIHSKISVKLPDNSLVDLDLDYDITLQDFIASLQSLEWRDKHLYIAEEIDDKHLSEPLSRLNFNSNTQVYLLENT